MRTANERAGGLTSSSHTSHQIRGLPLVILVVARAAAVNNKRLLCTWYTETENRTHPPRAADLVMVAWGTHATYLEREEQVRHLLRQAVIRPQCLKVTNAGHPAHPLYVPGKPTAMESAEAQGGGHIQSRQSGQSRTNIPQISHRLFDLQ